MSHIEKDKLGKTSVVNTSLAAKRVPADKCVICRKTIKEVGGTRITAQQSRGVVLLDEFLGGGDPERQYRSFKLKEDSDTYIVVWGENGFWSDDSVRRAVGAYRAGYHPWFCQVCGKRACRLCGAPINSPVGSDWIADSGCSRHSPILGCNPGCSNPRCSQYNESHKEYDLEE